MQAITSFENGRYDAYGNSTPGQSGRETADFFLSLSTTGQGIYGRYKTLPIVDCRFQIENHRSKIFLTGSVDAVVRA
jgi:hypothetical protein